jgi:hypothetical protein
VVVVVFTIVDGDVGRCLSNSAIVAFKCISNSIILAFIVEYSAIGIVIVVSTIGIFGAFLAGDMSPAKKAPKIPIVDTTITIPMAEYSTMKARIIELEMHLNATIAELDKHLPTSPSTIVNTTTTTTGKLPREIAFNYIKEHGNQFQSKAIAAETLHNTQLLNILQVVIEKRLKKVPHSGIPKDILAATEIV